MATKESDDATTNDETADDNFVRVADAEDLRENSPQIVNADGHSVALFYHEEDFHAVDNRCPHMGFPLSQGSVEDGILTCHWPLMSITGIIKDTPVNSISELYNRGVSS